MNEKRLRAKVPDVGGDRLRVSPADVAKHGPASALILSVLRYESQYQLHEGFVLIPEGALLRSTGLDQEDLRVELYRLYFRKVIEAKRFKDPDAVGYRFMKAEAFRVLTGALDHVVGLPLTDWTERYERQADKFYVQLHTGEPGDGFANVAGLAERITEDEAVDTWPISPGVTHWSKWTELIGGELVERGTVDAEGNWITEREGSDNAD